MTQIGIQNGGLISYFNSIKSEDDLRRMVTDRVKEDLHLEFKQKRDRRHAQLEKDDKKNFSKVLSGFANSDGGILIWGIETDDADESAKSLKPISDIDGFIKSLKSSLFNSVQPFVDDVLIEKIPTDASEEIGYVKCLIPQSEKTPHRAMLADREYYKRSTEGFYALEHFDLEDMFGRRQRPLLVPVITSISIPGDDADLREVRFAFRNEGRWAALHFGFLCKFDDNIKILSYEDSTMRDVTSLNNGEASVSYDNHIGAIHPNNITYNLGAVRYKKKDQTRKVMGILTYYCQGMMAKAMPFLME